MKAGVAVGHIKINRQLGFRPVALIASNN